MTVLATLDFEDQTDGSPVTVTAPWSITGTAPTASTEAALHGSLGAAYDLTGAGYIGYDTGAPLSAARVVSWYLRLDALPTANSYYATAWDAAGTVQAEIRVTTGGIAQLRDGSTSTGQNSPALTVGTIYRFEWRFDPTSATQSLHIFEGDSETAWHSSDGASLTSTTVRSMSVGPRAASSNLDGAIDTVRIADDWTGPYTEPEQPTTTTPVSRIDAGGTLTPVAITPLTFEQQLAPTAGTTVAPPWQAEQNPAVRGVTQDRITAVAGDDVPGETTDPSRPATAMRVELRPLHNNDITVTATAAADATATTITMSTADAANLRDLDFMINDRSGEQIRVASVSGTNVTVQRAQHTTAAAIQSGDTFTVWCGDVNDSGGNYPTSRAEVLVDLPSPTSTPAHLWPNPPGAERWYQWAAFVPADFTPATDTKWLTCFQIKGLYGGGPPLGMEIKRTNWRFSGTRGNGWTDATGTHPPAFADDGILGDYNAGSWTTFVVGVRLHPDPDIGWVEVWMNGTNVIPRMSLSTMDTRNNDGVTPDPVYIKQGIYRDPSFDTTAVLHYGPLTITATSPL